MSTDHPGAARDSVHERDYSDRPLVVTWEVTQACQLACDHCRADAQPGRHPDELTTAEGKHLIDQIEEFGSPPPVLVFSGGDPLERPDFIDLMEYASASTLRTGVTPAPTANLDQAMLERFADADIDRVALSLDGASADSHDSFRGEDGSFETIQRAAAYASEIGLSLQINTTVTAATADELPQIADLVEQLDAVVWEVFFLVPIGRGTALESLSPAEAERTLAWLYRRQRDTDFRLITVEAPQYRRIARQIERENGGGEPRVGSTGDGNGFVFVSHVGDVSPSGFLPVEVGNVREDDLVELYRESPLFQQLREPSEFSGTCGTCPHRTYCGGSRARAAAVTGDPRASDPLCSYTDLNDATRTDD